MNFEEAARKATNELYLKATIPTWDDMDKLAIHYEGCPAVGKWLGRNGNTPKDSLKVFPLPKHPDASRSCPGCCCDVFQSCLIRVANSSSKE
jgi:hypothetical protein